MPINSALYKLLSMMALFFLFSCTSEKPSVAGRPIGAVDRKSPVVSGRDYVLEITPLEPTRNSTLKLSARGFDLSSAEITWLVNGGILSDAGQKRISASEIARGDVVQVKAAVAGVVILSNTVEIRNTPPEITKVKPMSDIVKAGDYFSVDASVHDTDGDDVVISYTWTVNGLPAGEGPRLAITPVRGDKISVMIVPFDGTDYGTPINVTKTVDNMPPVITDHKEYSFDGVVYTYQVKAADPDSDDLTYSLKTAAAGVSIDPSTGLLKWAVPAEFTGSQEASILVNDGHGGTAMYGIVMIVR